VTPDQAIAFGILGATILLFVWGRLPYDLVALLALLAAVLAGVVPAGRAFAGFGDDVVVIVASALLVSAAVARSGAVEAAMRRCCPTSAGPRCRCPSSPAPSWRSRP
jgi:hypothetical protein